MASRSLSTVVAPGEFLISDLPALDASAPGEHWLTVAARLAAATPWAAAGHTVARTRVALQATTSARGSHGEGRATASRRVAEAITLGDATFDATSGALLRIGELAVSPPEVTLWRAPTENDGLASGGSYELGNGVSTRGRCVPGPSSAHRWRAIGLDRLHSRTTDVEAGDSSITVRKRIGAAGHSRAVLAALRWSWVDDLRLDLTAEPVGDWPTTWPRAGVHFALPTGYERAAWFGTGPAENCPDSRAAARVGRFAAPIDELGVAYAVPQETGHRADLRELTISGSYLPTLTVVTRKTGGRQPGFSLSRYSAEELDAARHPYESRCRTRRSSISTPSSTAWVRVRVAAMSPPGTSCGRRPSRCRCSCGWSAEPGGGCAHGPEKALPRLREEAGPRVPYP